MAMLPLQIQKDLEPTKTWQRPLKEYKGDAIATAQTFYIDIPRDHFIHEIYIQMSEGTASPGSLVDKLADVKLVGNGSKYLKDAFGLGSFFVQVERMNGKRHITGIYHLVFSDPAIPEAKPLPAWIFTSLQLIITDSAPAATYYRFLNITLIESAYNNEDLNNWKILVEKCVAWKKFGTNTGWQDYEHERAYKVFTYLYAFDDNGTLGDAVFNKLKVVGRNPRGEFIVFDEVLTSILQAQNKGVIVQDIDAGFAFVQFLKGFPTTEYSSLYSKLNIVAGGTNKACRVLERYLV